MKIAIYHNHYSKSSGEDVMFRLECDALEKRGHQVLPVTAHVNDVLAKRSKLELAKMAVRSAHNSASKELAERVIKDFQPDIAHVHNWFPILSPAIYVPHFEKGIPVVQTLHNYRLGCATGNFRYKGSDCEECLMKGRHRAVAKKCYQNSAVGSFFWKRVMDKNLNEGSFLNPMLHYICPSKEVLRRHLKIGIPESKMTFLPNACRDPLNGETPSKSDPIKCVYLGRLVGEKGVGTLIDAWKSLKQHSKNGKSIDAAELIIIGEGTDEDVFKTQANRVEGVRFTGYLSHEQTLDQLKSASVVVFPSQWAEPFGLGVIEGMAAGCAVIASNIGGPGELVQDGKNGWLFNAGDSDELNSKLRSALTDKENLKALGRVGRDMFVSNYQPQAHAKLLEELYGELLEKAAEGGNQ